MLQENKEISQKCRYLKKILSLKSLILSRHLLAQNQQQKHHKKAPTTPKANKKKK